MCRYLLIAAVSLIITPVSAAELGGLEAESIDLGGYRGVVYYTNDHGGYRVVTTIAEGETGLPVRFEATITDNQKLSISVPRKLGEQSDILEISRVGDKLLIAHPSRLSTNGEMLVAEPLRGTE